MTLNDTMQHYTTVYKTIQHYNYKAIWHHTTPYNVRYKTIQQYIMQYIIITFANIEHACIILS